MGSKAKCKREGEATCEDDVEVVLDESHQFIPEGDGFLISAVPGENANIAFPSRNSNNNART